MSPIALFSLSYLNTTLESAL